MKFTLCFLYILGLTLGFLSLGYTALLDDIDWSPTVAALPLIIGGVLFLFYLGFIGFLQVGSPKTSDLVGWSFLVLLALLSGWAGAVTLAGQEEPDALLGWGQVIVCVAFALLGLVGIGLTARSGGGEAHPAH